MPLVRRDRAGGTCLRGIAVAGRDRGAAARYVDAQRVAVGDVARVLIAPEMLAVRHVQRLDVDDLGIGCRRGERVLEEPRARRRGRSVARAVAGPVPGIFVQAAFVAVLWR